MKSGLVCGSTWKFPLESVLLGAESSCGVVEATDEVDSADATLEVEVVGTDDVGCEVLELDLLVRHIPGLGLEERDLGTASLVVVDDSDDLGAVEVAVAETGVVVVRVGRIHGVVARRHDLRLSVVDCPQLPVVRGGVSGLELEEEDVVGRRRDDLHPEDDDWIVQDKSGKSTGGRSHPEVEVEHPATLGVDLWGNCQI